MKIPKRFTHSYKNIQVVNKSSFSNKELNNLIKVSLPPKVMNKRIILIVLNKKNYKQELKKLDLDKFLSSTRAYPFGGITFFVKERMECNWVLRRIVIVLALKLNRVVTLMGDKKKGYLRSVTKNREELFVSILAHELKHVACAESTRKLSNLIEETICDKYAIGIVKAYRILSKKQNTITK